MEISKPASIPEYIAWLKKEQGGFVARRAETYYSSVVGKMRSDFLVSDFWQGLTDEIKTHEQAYLVQTGYNLLATPFAPDSVCIKPYSSFFLKSFRQNVLENKNWPNEPSGGWIVPPLWYEQIHDILRTLLVAKYLDGVKFLVDKFAEYCATLNVGAVRALKKCLDS